MNVKHTIPLDQPHVESYNKKMRKLSDNGVTLKDGISPQNIALALAHLHQGDPVMFSYQDTSSGTKTSPVDFYADAQDIRKLAATFIPEERKTLSFDFDQADERTLSRLLAVYQAGIAIQVGTIPIPPALALFLMTSYTKQPNQVFLQMRHGETTKIPLTHGMLENVHNTLVHLGEIPPPPDPLNQCPSMKGGLHAPL